ncbi:hypothetical protein ABOM_009456 [Aspergillus bombycis]|uniref:Uncharacterized protein n=1 Tax=Aspergillus bombycis TaxID=109264 RepID=A0A1F7ZR25_9EURO|nr:hypothetical protein ABOM_009456 [Aspergillus bombycis]OGM41729.1 hypothetical protein ABOM_009456 [Aspergillus bombycis]
MIRYKPTRVTLGENDVHDCLEGLLLRHTRFVEQQEQGTDQSDSENNMTVIKIGIHCSVTGHYMKVGKDIAVSSLCLHPRRRIAELHLKRHEGTEGGAQRVLKSTSPPSDVCDGNALMRCLIDNTGHAPTLSKSRSADADFELRLKTIAPGQFEVSAQSPSRFAIICLDKNANLQASPMTEPAGKTLKTTEGSKVDTSAPSHGEQAGLIARHNKGSGTESQLSEAELPHKACDAASLDITSNNGISSLAPLPQIISRSKEGNEYDMDKESDLPASSIERDQQDASYTHSRIGIPDDTFAFEPPLFATQIEDSMAEPNALMFTKEEMDRIGAMLYREADVALQGLVNSQCERAPAGEPGWMVSTSSKEHGGKDNGVDPHGGRLEPAGNEREPSRHAMGASVQFQNQVNQMMAELYYQVEDKAEDFGLASLRRKPLGEWYKGI